MDDNEVRSIRRREAKSGRVSFSDPIVLHETSRQRMVLVPFYIPRTEGTHRAIKIITYRKDQPPFEWVIREEKSISMQEAAARRLLIGLKEHLAVAEEEDEGSYILIRVSDGVAQIGEHDPAAVASALTRVLSQEEIVQHLGETELSDELINAFRGAIRLKEMRSAGPHLRPHLETDESSEEVYKRWCENHSWAFGNAYVMRDDVREISPGDRLDLLLPTVISGYRGIVELKRPDMSILFYDDAHRNYYFSADVSRAIGQCHRD